MLTPEETRRIHAAIMKRINEIENAWENPGPQADYRTIVRFVTMREGPAKRRLAALAYAVACNALHTNKI